MKKTPWQKEWDALLKKEIRYLKKNQEKQEFILNRKLEDKIPEALQEKLELAFYKSFQLVFEKGNPVIERLYSKEKQERAYKLNRYALELDENQKSLRTFSRQSNLANLKNLSISLGEGVLLGLPGIGLPDIPLFIGVILKSIYEIALSYGFSYDTDKERLFILSLIHTSLEKGRSLEDENARIDAIIKASVADSPTPAEMESAMRTAADTLSRELLYMKFLQGIPIAGVIGGLSDVVYLNKITEYASLKYRRRFLLNKMQP